MWIRFSNRKERLKFFLRILILGQKVQISPPLLRRKTNKIIFKKYKKVSLKYSSILLLIIDYMPFYLPISSCASYFINFLCERSSEKGKIRNFDNIHCLLQLTIKAIWCKKMSQPKFVQKLLNFYLWQSTKISCLIEILNFFGYKTPILWHCFVGLINMKVSD